MVLILFSYIFAIKNSRRWIVLFARIKRACGFCFSELCSCRKKPPHSARSRSNHSRAAPGWFSSFFLIFLQLKTPGDGFEPPLKESESFVLPLDDPGMFLLTLPVVPKMLLFRFHGIFCFIFWSYICFTVCIRI